MIKRLALLNRSIVFWGGPQRRCCRAQSGPCAGEGGIVALTRLTCIPHLLPQVNANLHVAFTASPVGEAFRVRSQRFLATINSTVIDW